MSDLPFRTGALIRLHGMLPEGATVLVAVSGGLDSMVLLHVLHRLSSGNRWRVAAGHFNHRLRGKAGDQDESLLREQCRNWSIPVYCDSRDVRGHARRNRVSLEMAARELRHAFLAQTALDLGSRSVATAHHADDQVELFVLRLFRGGGAGMAGMKWMGPSPANPCIQLIRPLLNQTKATLREYARQENIPFREDESNRWNSILRNRVRNDILPLLRRFQPSFDSAALRSMEIIGAESDFSRLAARRWLAGRQRSRFRALHPAIQRHVIQFRLIDLGIRPGFDLVEFLRTEPGRVLTLGPDLGIASDERGGLDLRKGVFGGFNPTRKEIRLSGKKGEVEFGGLSFRWSVRPRLKRHPERLPGEAGVEWFDAAKVGRPVILRHWQKGDRFQPIGMSRPTKLQDLLTNQKIPREKRVLLVVAASARGEIFWVEGLRIGESFKLVDDTTVGLRWTWSRQTAQD